jgi:hypothetical protein
MNYSKIKENIQSKKYLINNFIIEKIGMTVHGFNQTIAHETLKVRDLEKISKELRLPMRYWWEEEDQSLVQEQSKIYGEDPREVIVDLRRQIKGYVITIENLNKVIEECLEKDTPKKKNANSG